jgi:hypothetical protein
MGAGYACSVEAAARVYCLLLGDGAWNEDAAATVAADGGAAAPRRAALRAASLQVQ